jgi:hypothetical protein
MDRNLPANKLAFILYEGHNVPRYYEIKKGLFRFILYGLPLITFISTLISLVGFVYLEQLEKMAERKEPRIISELRLERDQLQANVIEIEKERKLLQDKIASGSSSSDTNQGLSTLALFKESPGRNDLTKSPELGLEEIEVSSLEDKVTLDFKIVNLTKDQKKFAGYIFVLMKSADQLHVWPAGSYGENKMHVIFNTGELFATSRFRPVKATFPLIDGNETLFKVLIFNRIGDLVYKQLISKNKRP